MAELDGYPKKSTRATDYFRWVKRGQLRVRTTDTMIFEAVFTMERQLQQPKSRVRDAVLPLIELAGVALPARPRLRGAFDLYADLNLPFADAYYTASAEHLELDEIVTFAREFDHVPGIRRVEPWRSPTPS